MLEREAKEEIAVMEIGELFTYYKKETKSIRMGCCRQKQKFSYRLIMRLRTIDLVQSIKNWLRDQNIDIK